MPGSPPMPIPGMNRTGSKLHPPSSFFRTPRTRALSNWYRCFVISAHMVGLQFEGLLPEISSGPPQDAARRHVDHEPHKVPVHEVARKRFIAVHAGSRL